MVVGGLGRRSSSLLSSPALDIHSFLWLGLALVLMELFQHRLLECHADLCAAVLSEVQVCPVCGPPLLLEVKCPAGGVLNFRVCIEELDLLCGGS